MKKFYIIKITHCKKNKKIKWHFFTLLGAESSTLKELVTKSYILQLSNSGKFFNLFTIILLKVLMLNGSTLCMEYGQNNVRGIYAVSWWIQRTSTSISFLRNSRVFVRYYDNEKYSDSPRVFVHEMEIEDIYALS